MLSFIYEFLQMISGTVATFVHAVSGAFSVVSDGIPWFGMALYLCLFGIGMYFAVRIEKKQIPEDIDYDKVNNIASEARQKLKEVRPTTIAQAIRISGVNPADISILSVYLKKEYGKDE